MSVRDAYSLAPSQRDAETVRAYLIEKDRLVARRCRKMRPVADNATELGRYRKHRVELRSLD